MHAIDFQNVTFRLDIRARCKNLFKVSTEIVRPGTKLNARLLKRRDTSVNIPGKSVDDFARIVRSA